MNREQLGSYLGMTGYTLGQVEKDYFQNIILSTLSRTWADKLLFKGGTALQKMGFIKRFSEDLDFTALDLFDLKHLLDGCVGAVRTYGHMAHYDKVSEKGNATSARFMVEGPLFDKGGVHCSIVLDISHRERPVMGPVVREFTPIYPEILPYFFPVMDPEEVLSEKIRALMTRKRPRDLFDASMMLERGVPLRRDVIENKLGYYGIMFDTNELLKRCQGLFRTWETELGPLIGSVPDHSRVISIMERAVREQLI